MSQNIPIYSFARSYIYIYVHIVDHPISSSLGRLCQISHLKKCHSPHSCMTITRYIGIMNWRQICILHISPVNVPAIHLSPPPSHPPSPLSTISPPPHALLILSNSYPPQIFPFDEQIVHKCHIFTQSSFYHPPCYVLQHVVYSEKTFIHS